MRVPRTIGTDASGPACIFARVEITKGQLAYLRDNSRIPAPRRFAVFLPPFTLVQALLERCEVSTAGIAFRPPTGTELPSRPVLVPFAADECLTAPADVIRWMCDVSSSVEIGRAADPVPLAMRAKAILDAEYDTPLPIGRIANRLRTSPAVLSRSFSRAYGIPPVVYRHHVRIMDALLRFAEGAAPAAVSQDVGFDDLSRFYKILRKVACAPPGTYRPARSRNAKT